MVLVGKKPVQASPVTTCGSAVYKEVFECVQEALLLVAVVAVVAVSIIGAWAVVLATMVPPTSTSSSVLEGVTVKVFSEANDTSWVVGGRWLGVSNLAGATTEAVTEEELFFLRTHGSAPIQKKQFYGVTVSK